MKRYRYLQFACVMVFSATQSSPVQAIDAPVLIVKGLGTGDILSAPTIPVVYNPYQEVEFYLIAPRTADLDANAPKLDINLIDGSVKTSLNSTCAIRGHSYYGADNKETYSGSCTLLNIKGNYSSSILNLSINYSFLGVRYEGLTIPIDINSILIPYWELNSAEFDRDGNFKLVAQTFIQASSSNLGNKVIFTACFDSVCQSFNSNSSGMLNLEKKLKLKEFDFKLTASSNDHQICMNSSCPYDNSKIYTYSEHFVRKVVEAESTPSSKLSVRIVPPISAKLGIPFITSVSLIGSGSATCNLYTANSTNGGSTFSSQGWNSPKFTISTGKVAKVKTIMTTNAKGVWGVMVTCIDKSNGGSTGIKIARMVQN